MDPQRERIFDDLRGLVAGDVRCDDLTLALYATDASIHRVRPVGVVCPRHTGDVAAVVQYAGEAELAVHARGAGTGLSGGAIGPGIVLDFSRHMRRVIARDDDGALLRVQPGVVLGPLNENLRQQHRHFAPDPANADVTTLGSVLALDASGSRWLKHGSARRYVQTMQVVLADGTVAELGRHPMHRADDSPPAEAPGDRLAAQIGPWLAQHAGVIEQHQPPGCPNRGGYRLNDVLVDDELDLAKLLCGSQGTLAIITEATIATSPLPAHVGVALLMFDRLESAAQAVPEIVALGAAACDLIDRRHLVLARESDVRYDQLISPAVEALLVVECVADSAATLRDELAAIVVRVCRDLKLAFDARQTLDPEEIDLYWRLATHVVPRLYRLSGSTRALPFVEDLTVPVPALAEFLVRMQNVFKQQHVTASLYGHAGHGRLHIRPFVNLADPADVARMQPLADDLYREVFALGGAIGGETGDGYSRTSFLRRQYGPLYDVMADIKQAFDPRNVLNPGQVIGDDAQQLTRQLRPQHPAGSRVEIASSESTGDATVATSGESTITAEPPAEIPTIATTVVPLQLEWSTAEAFEAARNCNGCGECRTLRADRRMCPLFRNAPREEASPRAKANLLRDVLAGNLDAGLLPSDELKRVADLCVHCHQCRLECPASVDIPRLMVEAKAAHVAHDGLKPSDWFVTHLDTFAAASGAVRPLVNWMIGNRQSRWVLEKLVGIAQGRKLPRLAKRGFLRTAVRKRWHRPTKTAGRKVAFFVDTYVNHFDPELGLAFAAILRHNGIECYVPSEQQPAGMALIALGAVVRARKLAARNVSLLAEAVRQGYHIVATEPSAALCLTHEYLHLLDDDEARLVADHSSEACTYLWRLHQQGQLRLDFRPLSATVGYHQPCHLKALGVGTPGQHLLGLIPGLNVSGREVGCSGMAGTYGLKRENYRSSLRAGWGLISRMREPQLTAGATECSTCKIQMEQGTPKPTLHPLKLLALAYGLLPELATLLERRGQDLVVT